MLDAPDYYAVLEVAPEAEAEIIRAAYLVLAKRYHPDTAAVDSPHNDEKFHLITEAYEILRDPDLREQYDHARQERYFAQLEEDAHNRARQQARRKQRERAVPSLFVVVFAVGGFALGALALGLVKALAPNSFLANIDLAIHTEKFERSSSLLSDKAAQNQELTDLRQALQQAEGLAATYQELLTQERARNLELEKQVAARQDVTPAGGHDVMPSLSQTPDPTQAPAPHKPATVPLPTSDKPMTLGGDRPATMAGERARADALAGDLDTAQRRIEALTAATSAAASEAPQAKQAAERSATAEKALPEERARADALARDLDTAQRRIEALTAATSAAASEAAQAKQAAERSATAEKALPEERARADALARDLDTAQRRIEALTAATSAAASEAAQAKQAAERSATAEKALPEERARADALTRDLDTAQRKIEALTAATSAANGETARVREDAMRAAEELQRSRQQERARTDALERDLAAVRREFEAQVNASAKFAEETTRLQQTAERAAAELRHERQEEHYKAEKLARELAAARRELETQATRLAKTGDKTAQNQELTELRQSLQQAQTAAAASQELLVQERARNLEIEKQVAARQDAPAARGRNVMPSLSQTPDPTQSSAPDKPATVPLPTSDKPMTHAKLLLNRGNIGGARIVLERAIEMGSAPALFALAETYDPAILSTWGTFGTQGDVGKAQELYAKAFARGIWEAKDRLNASRW